MKKLTFAGFSSPVASWFARLFFVAAFSVVLSASASASADGKYKYRSAKGSFTIAGQSIKVGKQDLKALVAKKKGSAVVKNNKIQLSPNGGTKLIDEAFSGPDYNINVKATGPKSITLKKKGKAYSGKASSPIVVTVSGAAAGQPINGTFEYQFNAKVKGKKLLFTVPVGGGFYGIPVTGTIKILCQKR